ncbi:alpha-hydroxy acid oxidase [Microbispora hainanensis]|uniref:alpha-hydroxy acid oxidase n=1 Tax=Microbispora hainanensis TaxID=568844 RepID=UPI0033F257C3
MRPGDVLDLVWPGRGVEPPSAPEPADGTGPVPPRRPSRSLRGCLDIEDLRRLARRALPRPIFDYVDGGADDELTLAANRRAFAERRFAPRVLRDVSAPDLSCRLFGRDLSAPVGLAPTGYTRIVHPDGEPAAAGAAAALGLPYTLSTMATTSIEDLAATGVRERWFQLYVWRDRARTESLIDRAAEAGYRVLVVAVDTPVAGMRRRDARNGLVIPPRPTAGALAGIARRPGYWIRLLRSPAITFANLTGSPGDSVESISSMFDPAFGWRDLAAIRSRWPGPLMIKGPLSPEDARQATDVGVDGVYLSNHGGRQLDRCATPLDLLPGVRAAVGARFTVIVDSGIRHGADVAVALALGADAAFVGRPYLYGLAAAGQAGAEHALRLLTGQLRRTMQLLGVATLDALRAEGAGLLIR